MGAIINIFKSIISAITGLFGGKKDKDGFLMEAPAAKEAAAAPAVKAAVAAPAPEAAAPAAKAGQKAKGKAGKAATAAAAAAVTMAAAPVTDTAALIASAVSASNQSGPTFAEMNAVPMSTGGRRRPGANMAGFMDMAKTMRTR